MAPRDAAPGRPQRHAHRGPRSRPLAARRAAAGVALHARRGPPRGAADRPAARRRTGRCRSADGGGAAARARALGACARSHRRDRAGTCQPRWRGVEHARRRRRPRHQSRPLAAAHARGAGAGATDAALQPGGGGRRARAHGGRPLPGEVQRRAAQRPAAAVRDHRQLSGRAHRSQRASVPATLAASPRARGTHARVVLHQPDAAGRPAAEHGRHAARHRAQRARAEAGREPAARIAWRRHRPAAPAAARAFARGGRAQPAG